MAEIHGFELIREQKIPELFSTGKLFKHTRTGAVVLVVENEDENKAFNIAFRTPPPDSTGMPHILEHSVLGGSEKYPVKEPYVELVKGSLNTFVNAITWPDVTDYPFASQNLQDFYNIFDVYMDAVLHPRISEDTLAQEGWHYELESVDGELSYKGIVFNEMKGALSDPDQLFDYHAPADLFPDTQYKNYSGGDPLVMPDLTYEKFKNFYKTYYHPSNSFSFFYGNGNTEEHLRRLAEWFEPYDARPVDSFMALQKPFTEPKRTRYPFEASEEDRPQARLAVNWVVGEMDTTEKDMALTILDEILVGTPASPLRKALIDSGLGEEVISGVESIRQTYFKAGLKGIKEEDADKVEALMFDTLRKLAEEGIDPETIKAAVNTIEFRLRELNWGSFPRGLVLGIFTAQNAFVYGRDPLEALSFEGPLQVIKAHLAAGDNYFEKLIRSWLLENPYRLSILLYPKAGYNQELEQAEQKRLEKERQSMSTADLEQIVQKAKALKDLQEAPDAPEALATIPTLTLVDLEKKNKFIPLAETELSGVKVLSHDISTNGIVYLDLVFDLHALPADLLPLTVVFGRALLEMGAGALDFVGLTLRIKANTGGINSTTLAQAVHGQDVSATKFVLRAKATVPQAGEMLAILSDVLLSAHLDEKERFRQILLEQKSGIEASLVQGGNSYAVARLRAQFDESGWASEQISGITALFAIRKLIEQVDADWPGVLAKLEEIRSRLVTRPAMLVNVTLDDQNWQAFQPRLGDFLGKLPDKAFEPQTWPKGVPAGFQGLAIPSQVNFVAKAANIYANGFPLNGGMFVAGKYLVRTWIWNKVRVQGGAYSGRGALDQRSGVWAFSSYRDPNLLSTLDAYDGSGDYLRGLANGELSQEELVRAIIGAISDWDAYLLPDAKGYSSMVHWLVGENPEMRQRLRDQILGTRPSDFANFASAMDVVCQKGQVVVVGSQAALEAANKERGGFLKIERVL